MVKVDKYSIHGLKRRPTYDEIIGMIDDSNEKITSKLPNRDASFSKILKKVVTLMVQMLWNN